MAKLAELRKKAKGLGISASVIRGATTASELEQVISDHSAHGGKARKKAHKKSGATKKASAVKKSTGRKRGRPKGSKNSTRKASAPARSRKSGAAKRSGNSSGYVPKGGRNLLDSVDYSETEGWNARAGSAPDRIVKALKRFRGNREKVFDHLKADVWDFVGKRKQNGDKRTKQEALDMLRYRISRTAWDFAMRTGQHEAASNRVEYGTGGTGEGVFKRAKKGRAQSRSKSTTRKTTRKAARKPAGRKKATGTRRAPAKRGRPKARSRR